jgi:hypothetical protein
VRVKTSQRADRLPAVKTSHFGRLTGCRFKTSHERADRLSPAAAQGISTSTLAGQGPASQCAPYREVILAKLASGLSIKRVHQDLAAEVIAVHFFQVIGSHTYAIPGSFTTPVLQNRAGGTPAPGSTR